MNKVVIKVRKSANLEDRQLTVYKEGKKTTTTRPLLPVEREFLLYFQKADGHEQRQLLSLLINARRDFKAAKILTDENLKHLR